MEIPLSRAASRIVFPGLVVIRLPSMVSVIMNVSLPSAILSQGHDPDPIAARAARRLAHGLVDLEARLHLDEALLPLFRGEHWLMRPLQAADEADFFLFVVHLDRGEQGLEPFPLRRPGLPAPEIE